MSKHFRVPSRLPAKLEELGVRVSAVLRSAGLPRNLFEQSRVLVTTEEFFALWRGIGELSGDPAIGLLLGTESKPEHFDPVALAALSADNFGAAVQQIARYKLLSCPEEIVHRAEGDEWSIHFRWLLAQEDEPCQRRFTSRMRGSRNAGSRSLSFNDEILTPSTNAPSGVTLQLLSMPYWLPLSFHQSGV